MPSVFGIINTHLQAVFPEAICRMKDAATYVKPRKLVEHKTEAVFFASAVIEKDHKSIAMNDIWLAVADASLYKRIDLAGKLGINNNAIPSDVLLILQSWKKWGVNCIEHLYGDFAFVIFNTETGEIYCGRDHLGVRPLFYSFNNDVFLFASELRTICAALPEMPSASFEYLLDSLVNRRTGKSESAFESIKRLPPAHFLHISNGRMVLQKYWQLNPKKRLMLSSEKEYTDLLRDKLVKAVEIRCEDVGTGAELSGGLDSSCITGMAASYLRKRGKALSTYSNVFPEGTEMDIKDERVYIAEMVKYTSAPWKGLDHLGRSIPDLLQYDIGVQGCFIQQNFSMLSDALYEAAGRDHIKVLLSGFGGDEMVSSPTGVLWSELLVEREWRIILDELFYKNINKKSLFKAGIILYRYLYTQLKKPGKTSGVFTKELIDGRFQNIPLQRDFADKHNLRQRLADQYVREKRSTLAMKQFDRIMHDHVPQRMENCYAAAAQYGIEHRYPLLDVDLIETFLAFPSWMKQHHGINRYAFREAMTGFVPETIRNRNDKSGSTIPQTFYSLLNDREEILDVIRKASKSPKLQEVFNFEKFERWYEKIVKRDPKDNGYLMRGALFTYLMILLYYRDTWNER